MGIMIDPQRISTWIEQKESAFGKDQTLAALNVASNQTFLETDALLQSSQHLKKAFSELVGKYVCD